MKELFKVITIEKKETYEWFKKKHYAKRIPQLVSCFGLYDTNNLLQGVLSYGIPASPSLVKGAFKGKYQDDFYELNRLCVNNNLGKNVLSFFVSQSIKLLQKPKVLVSYADTSQGHTGYIYQATNWIYTGLSDKRTEWRMRGNNKHSKTICEQYTLEERQKDKDKFYIIERPRKHRYFYLLGNKKEKKDMKNNLVYDILPNPKGDNKRYDCSYNPSIQRILFV